MKPRWQRYLDGIPPYLARFYWWAYLDRRGVWFFDHALVIDAILFGHYRALAHAALDAVDPQRRTLMVANVYGSFVPMLAQRLARPLVLIDVAPIQLQLARKKLSWCGCSAHLLRMDAERLGFVDGAFAQVIVFFFWHEMPADARERSIKEAFRVLASGGRLIVVEYGAFGQRHWLHRKPFSSLLMHLEPFLDDFWRMDLPFVLQQTARARFGRNGRVHIRPIFGGFYRVLVWEEDDDAA